MGWGSGNLASRVKRRRVNDRVVVPVSVVAGIAAAASGASPTGTTWSDWLLIVASVALVSWAGASTGWWVGAALAGLAAAIAGDLALTTIGLATFAGSLWIGLQRRDLPVARAVVIDGDDPAPFTLDDGSEAGWNVASAFVAIPPGESVTVTIQLAGAVEQPAEPTLVVRPMPMVLPERHRIDAPPTAPR